MASQIFNAALSTTFQPSRPIQFSAGQIAVDFEVVITRALTRVLWYFEYTEGDPNSSATRWFRETAEENQGSGDVCMSLVLRRLAQQGADDLPVGTYQFGQQFLRAHRYYRIQAAIVAGGGDANLQIWDVFGEIPQSIG